jgi:hypothetical protein
MKFIVAFLLIFCAVLWINNNSSYVVFSNYTIKDLQTYVSEKGGLFFSKVGQDIGEIDWKIEKR